MSVFLGLDSSTQGLKASVIDAAAGKILATANVNYTRDLSEFNCPEGALPNPNPRMKHADPLMWTAALDLVLERLRGVDPQIMASIQGISGSGQQHGSVYLNEHYTEILDKLLAEKALLEQVRPALARATAPIWMDSSTTDECAEISAAIGERLRLETGSPAIPRFTGPQIRRFWKTAPAEYEATAKIHLVSSYMCSLLCGKSAAIDYGDGAGMNLLNLKSLRWDRGIADATAPDLLRRLPAATPSDTIAGGLHQYFTKYGLKAGIPVVVWSGDNPNSLVGTGAWEPGTAVISLGTSDTFFAAIESFKVDPGGCGHVFGNPAGGLMALICFTNGSLAREKVKHECGDVDWNFFDVESFNLTEPGNGGNMMLPYFVPETTPLVLESGVRLAGDADFVNGRAAAAVKIRAIVESQALSMRSHSEWIGDFKTLRVTGGASRSPGLCQVFADVFQAKIEKISVPDSAGLGAAMRAANAIGHFSWGELSGKFAAATETVSPNPANAEVYERMLAKFRALEAEHSRR